MPNLNQSALTSLIISIIIFIIVLILIIAVSYNWRISYNNNQPMIKNPQFLAAAMYNKNNFASPSGGSGSVSGKNVKFTAAIAQREANGINIANGCGDTAIVGVGGICNPIVKNRFQGGNIMAKKNNISEQFYTSKGILH